MRILTGIRDNVPCSHGLITNTHKKYDPNMTDSSQPYLLAIM